VLEAAFWGFVGGASLLIGTVVGLRFDLDRRVIGAVMGLGAGVLISAVAFDLTEEAFHIGGRVPVVLGLATGGLAYFAVNQVLARRGAHRRKSPVGRPGAEPAGTALLVGALLDGIPESMAIGTSIAAGGEVGVAIVAAVFLSNIPESLASATGARHSGESARSPPSRRRSATPSSVAPPTRRRPSCSHWPAGRSW
jgi:ZIP family zinc transporter